MADDDDQDDQFFVLDIAYNPVVTGLYSPLIGPANKLPCGRRAGIIGE